MTSSHLSKKERRLSLGMTGVNLRKSELTEHTMGGFVRNLSK